MSKRYNFGQIAGLVIGATLGALGINYAYNRFFAPTHRPAPPSATTGNITSHSMASKSQAGNPSTVKI